MKERIVSVILSLFFTLLFSSCGKKKSRETKKEIVTTVKWRSYRGVNVGCEIEEQDVKDLAASKANLIRLSMPVCFFMELEEPYTYKPEAFQKLDSVLNWGKKYGVAVLLDPHRYPGTKHEWTMLGNDPFWKDFKYHDLLIKFWDSIATRYATRGSELAGYDLLNEPVINTEMKKGSPQDISLLYKKLTKTIRKKDSIHTIVYALPRIRNQETNEVMGYHKGINYIELPDDDNICIETHTYIPMAFTHQNIWEEGEDVPYPTQEDSLLWNKDLLEKEQRELIAFGKENPSIPIIVGEFSCPRWTGEDGLQYITDVIEIAEKHNWSWAYHAYREASVWDAEMSITDKNDSLRTSEAPRWKMLESYFKKNN